VYGDSVVKTTTFDRMAKEGVLFEHAYVSSPSCTPSRNAILTGQYHWRLKDGANLWSTLDTVYPVYPLLLEEAGYHVGRWRKCWGPGNLKAGGYVDNNPGGKEYPEGFDQFLAARPDGAPFCFWLGASDPHRPYKAGSGAKAGIPVDQVQVPPFYPDVDVIRSDIADYYFEVERFNRDVENAIQKLEEMGELENTIVVMTGDNGIPFPRCKSNLYDMGVRVPLAVRWGKQVPAGRLIKDFVSLCDWAPTFLEVAGIEVPEQMTGRSLLPLLLSEEEGWLDEHRKRVVFGKERHVPAQKAPSLDGYPSRGIRTADYLYIRNFNAERWPAGVPEGSTHPMKRFADCDNGPTKTYLMAGEEVDTLQAYYDWSFAMRPEEELYDIHADPFQLINLADHPDYQEEKKRLWEQLKQVLIDSKDPRVTGRGDVFDKYPYRSSYPLKKGKS
jgi:arylsulfatase A-like enzyme